MRPDEVCRLREWKPVLRQHAPIAPQMLQKLLQGRIVFRALPEIKRTKFA